MQLYIQSFLSYRRLPCSWLLPGGSPVPGYCRANSTYRRVPLPLGGITGSVYNTLPYSNDADCSGEVVGGAWALIQRRGPKIVKPRDTIRFWKIRVGDKVTVISGKEKGKSGEVLACDKLRNQVKVKGCNMVGVTTVSDNTTQRRLVVDGQVAHIEKKIHYSNVQLVDPLLNCATRVAIRFSGSNEPLRVSKKSGYVIPWPEEKPDEEKGTAGERRIHSAAQKSSRARRTPRLRLLWSARTTTKRTCSP
ncbi:50S ribosomal subunit L24, putative [Babesia bigemina]|uniref:Large ribosomal subunit protein uL24c n=1 Tax=Babesia bigemina TaxID=5866 RepID=A0A061CZB3_BABBI|nr:50S ribosomal subunit L24, putative [Babesia bigemina]CDR93966.1 50S ribosomal subunit L24, putative [Babesia bigemina]|eukprot:XP_012766152.1 50S ribosomal subunit L24, putative [Babesia bigemina]